MSLRVIRIKIIFLKILKRISQRVPSESRLFVVQTLLETSFSHGYAMQTSVISVQDNSVFIECVWMKFLKHTE